ncbi:MAG: hypothetical protein KAH54_04670 [Candidatus Sabulitectum sp.]|nr:hypothetical protein [Candidatus Sabulitectum sp.]
MLDFCGTVIAFYSVVEIILKRDEDTIMNKPGFRSWLKLLVAMATLLVLILTTWPV